MDKHYIDKEDGQNVGKRQILSSPNVAEAPPRVNEPVPVPSVYHDERGSIHNFKVGGRRLNVLHTKSGVMRSGDLHRVVQNDFVFSGEVEVWCLNQDGRSTMQVYKDNQYLAIPAYTPHVFHYKKDTVMAEWWDGPFHSWFYEPYRKIVEKSFRSTKPSRFDYYMVSSRMQGGQTESFLEVLSKQQVWWLGLAVGLGMGCLLRSTRR